MQNLPAPRSITELRASKTADISGDRDAPASGPRSTPCARLVMGENKTGAEFSFDGRQPKSCFDCLDRSTRQNTSSIASHRLAPHAKKGDRQLVLNPYPRRKTPRVLFEQEKTLPLFQQKEGSGQHGAPDKVPVAP